MKAICKSIRLSFNESNRPELTLSLSLSKQEAMIATAELRDILVKGKELVVEVKQYRHKRSLDANAYMWVLLTSMAAALHTTKDELYLLVLERYGVFTHVVVKPNVVDRVKAEWRTVRELGEVKINSQTGVQLQCFFGSSTYDTKEMSVLIDGVVTEANEMGIDTATPAEIALLKQEWGK
jgi:hypothetical protein